MRVAMIRETMKILIAIGSSGVKVERVVAQSLPDELGAAVLLAAVQKQLADLDRAVKAAPRSVSPPRQRSHPKVRNGAAELCTPCSPATA